MKICGKKNAMAANAFSSLYYFFSFAACPKITRKESSTLIKIYRKLMRTTVNPGYKHILAYKHATLGPQSMLIARFDYGRFEEFLSRTDESWGQKLKLGSK
jgi:hypothetical protein